MKHLHVRRTVGVSLGVLAIALLASGCDWDQFGNTAGHTWDNSAGETAITPNNVSGLTAHFTATDGTAGGLIPQAVANGMLYASNASGLEVYSANGTTGCTNSTCAPLWTYPSGSLTGGVAISNGVVFAPTSSGLEAFDGAGQTNCSGTPTVCQPLWSSPGTFVTPTVDDNTVFETTNHVLDAFDAAGSTDCAGTPKVCSPIWTALNVGGVVSVTGTTAYVPMYSPVTLQTGVFAFDATGVNGCSGTPKVCTPLKEYATKSQLNMAGNYAVVSGSTLYIDTFDEGPLAQLKGDIEAFNTGCGTTFCTPIWTDNGYYTSGPPIVGDGELFPPFFLAGEFPFQVLSASGPSSSALWQSSNDASALSIGGSVLYATSGTEVQAYDAGGTTGCSGSPEVCSALWSAPGTDAIPANGTVYVSTSDSSGHGEIVAYGLS